MAGDWWVDRTLGAVTENFDHVRQPVREADRRPGPFPYYGASGVVDYVDDYLLDGEYLLVAEDGENLRTRKTPVAFLATGKFWVNNHAHVVRGNGQANTRYLMYALQQIDLSGYLSGSTMPKLTQRALNAVRLRLPSIDQQHAIVQVVGSLDDKVELNRRMSETLEQMARALFKAWFVDRADSPPDVVPGEWLDAPLSTIAKVHRDKWDPGAEPDVSVHHFSLPAYDAGRWPIHEPGRAIKSTKTRVPAGSVLLSRLNPRIRRVWLTDVAPDVPAVASTEFLVLTPKPPFGRAFLYLAVSADDFQGTLVSRATGTSGSHQRVRPASVLDVPVPGPPEDLLAAFEPVAGGLLDRWLICARESQTLAALRDALLPKLISGDLRIPDAERIVSEVT